MRSRQRRRTADHEQRRSRDARGDRAPRESHHVIARREACNPFPDRNHTTGAFAAEAVRGIAFGASVVRHHAQREKDIEEVQTRRLHGDLHLAGARGKRRHSSKQELVEHSGGVDLEAKLATVRRLDAFRATGIRGHAREARHATLSAAERNLVLLVVREQLRDNRLHLRGGACRIEVQPRAA